MKYIIFDMEWNQPSAENVKIPELTHGEIIQIGFFVLDEKLSILHKDEFFIKPVCYKCMNKYVSALTGITQTDIDNGLSFETAIKRMAEHFDENTVIMTWGDDDIPILNDNLRFNGIKDIVLPKHYNLQRIFSMQTGSEARQTGLKNAMEALGINSEFQAHDALNDAYMTVLVAGKLDLVKGIADYNKFTFKKPDRPNQQPWLIEKPVRTKECSYTGSIDGLASYCIKSEASCPECGESCSRNPVCRQGRTTFITKVQCEQHGDFYIRYELTETTLKEFVFKGNKDFSRVYKNKLKQREKRLRYRELHKAANNARKLRKG